jgi:hypothetical protein
MSTPEPFTPDNTNDEPDAQPGAETADDELSLNAKALGDASSQTPTPGTKLNAAELEDRI